MKLNILQANMALDTLIELAAFDDKQAECLLNRTGRYTLFDEPNAVKKARETLKQIGYDHVYE